VSPRVAIATCAELPKGEEDGPLLETALRACGIEPETMVWDDPATDWSVYDLVVIRSTWDYTDKLPAFREWIGAVPRLLNPPPVVAWNTEKTYLAELTAAGVPTIPTTVLRPGAPFTAPAGEFVVKPAVSAGSRDTTRFLAGEGSAAGAEVARLHEAGRIVVVQPYVASVDARGETAVLFLGGAFSHSVTKGPMLTPDRRFVDRLYYEEDIAPRTATGAELAAAERALAAVPGGPEQLLYARVDLVDGEDGPLVLELELTEPSLFLAHAPGAADRLAAAIVAVL
jgi:glutathione synthase/RimK-type ligase-like ATP-grasp enzyme